MLYIFFFIIAPLTLPLLIYGLMKRITRNESEKLFFQPPKAIWGFKIIMTLFLSIPLLFCILDYIFRPINYDDFISSLPIFIFFGTFPLAPFLFAFASYPGYNYLFEIKNNKKAQFVLAVPFIAILLLSFLLSLFDNLLYAIFIHTGIPLILLVPYVPMAIILYKIRQKKKDNFKKPSAY